MLPEQRAPWRETSLRRTYLHLLSVWATCPRSVWLMKVKRRLVAGKDSVRTRATRQARDTTRKGSQVKSCTAHHTRPQVSAVTFDIHRRCRACWHGRVPERFETCISDLADSLDRIVIADELLPIREDGKSVEGSLNRLKAFLSGHNSLGDVVIDREIATLQKIRGLRHCHARSGAAGDHPRILRELGLGAYVSDWSRLWGHIRGPPRF